MTQTDLASEVIRDLLRSGWIIERARHDVYISWGGHDREAAWAAERAGLIATALEANGRPPDNELVAPHARWMLSVGGGSPDEFPLAPMFMVRMADWVDGHVGPFLDDDEPRLREIGAAQREALRFPGSLPAPPPYRRLDIPELKPPGKVRFTFGILGDLHVGSPNATDRVRAAIADLNASGAELVIQLGDITDHGNKDEFETAMQLLAKLEMPHATMMGNHDVYSIGEGRLSGKEYYSSYFGREPDGVVLHHKGISFAVLDSIEHAASPFSPFDLVTGRFIEGADAGAVVRGTLTHPQHDILADIAGPEGGPAFIFLHHPTQPYTGFPPVLFGLRDEDAGRIHAVCDSGNVWGVFAGHTHRNARTRDYDGVPVHEVAIPRDYPNGYALVDVCEDGYRYRFVQISDEKLLRAASESTGPFQQRYGRGTDEELSFVWTRPSI